jgi:hypothetical protein
MQPIEENPRQELNPRTRIQTHINTYRREILCVRTHRFTDDEHKIVDIAIIA